MEVQYLFNCSDNDFDAEIIHAQLVQPSLFEIFKMPPRMHTTMEFFYIEGYSTQCHNAYLRKNCISAKNT